MDIIVLLTFPFHNSDNQVITLITGQQPGCG